MYTNQKSNYLIGPLFKIYNKDYNLLKGKR